MSEREFLSKSEVFQYLPRNVRNMNLAVGAFFLTICSLAAGQPVATTSPNSHATAKVMRECAGASLSLAEDEMRDFVLAAATLDGDENLSMLHTFVTDAAILLELSRRLDPSGLTDFRVEYFPGVRIEKLPEVRALCKSLKEIAVGQGMRRDPGVKDMVVAMMSSMFQAQREAADGRTQGRQK